MAPMVDEELTIDSAKAHTFIVSLNYGDSNYDTKRQA